MSKSLAQLYLTKNGGTKYYLMFHIKAWMRDLPSFKKKSLSQKNHKGSLRTSDLSQALNKMHDALARQDFVLTLITMANLLIGGLLLKNCLTNMKKIALETKVKQRITFKTLCRLVS